MMPMREDRERRELQRLRDEFLEIMRRENEAVLFDEEAQRRIGQSIGRSLRAGTIRLLRPARKFFALAQGTSPPIHHC